MLALLAFAATAAAEPAPPEPPPLTRETVAQMAPEQVARRVLGEVGSMVHLWQVRGSPARRSDLGQIDFLTHPRGSYRAGLCETDWLAVGFGPVLTADLVVAVRPNRLWKSQFYIVRDGALAVQNRPLEEEERADHQAACAAVDPRKGSLVTAATAFEVAEGYAFLTDLIVAAKANRPLAPLDCADMEVQPISEAECVVRLSRLDPADFYGSTLDPGCGRKEADVHCRTIRVHDVPTLVIRGEWRRGSERPHKIIVGRDAEELIGH